MSAAQTPAGLPVAALQVAVLKELADQVKAAYDAARAGVTSDLVTLHEMLGVKTIEVRLPDAGVIAQITLSTPAPGVDVADEDAFLAWCEAEHPTEVIEVPARRVVRENSRKVLLSRLTVADLSDTGDSPRPAVVDPTTGRVVPWARVTPPGKPTPTLTWKSTGRLAVAQAWRDGRLALADHLALPQQH